MEITKKMGRVWLRIVAGAGLFLLFISLPLLIRRTEAGGIGIDPMGVLETWRLFIRGFQDGSSWSFRAGAVERTLLDVLPRYSWTSLFFTLLGTGASVFVGILGGIFSARRNNKATTEVIHLLNMIPDFLFALFLQMLCILFYQTFGVRLARMAYFTQNDPAILLPLLTMISVGGVFLLRSVRLRAQIILRKDYMVFARSRGIPEYRLLGRHLLSALLPGIEADGYRLAGLIIGDLFIIERIFNIPGLTRLIFSYGFSVAYDGVNNRSFFWVQFNVVFFALLGIVAIFFINVALIRLIAWLLKKGVS